MRYNNDLGSVCHWCGQFTGTKRGLRTGNHVFCNNGGKCKMAHARAFGKYKARVTARSARAAAGSSTSGPGGNGAGRRESKAIAKARSSSGNARKPKDVVKEALREMRRHKANLKAKL